MINMADSIENYSDAVGNYSNFSDWEREREREGEEQEQQRPSMSMEFQNSVIKFYEIGVPVMLVVCSLTFIVNIIIVVSSKWMRRPLTPTMLFSVSLAGADAVASLIVGLGLVLNRYC